MKIFIKYLFYVAAMVAFAGFLMLCFVRACPHAAHAMAVKPPTNSFIGGYDHARSFLNPNRHRGKNFRRRLANIEKVYGDWCEEYMPDHVPECLIRIAIEALGHDGSRTKDTKARECGLTSIGYKQAAMLCDEYGICGDPCWDAEFAIGAYAWLVYDERKTLLTKKWITWLPKQCEDNRIECEFFITLAMDTNDGKVILAVNKAGFKNHKHTWWRTVEWLRKQNDDILRTLLGKLAVSLHRFGLRWGFVLSKFKVRKEHYGDDYGWGELIEEPPRKPPALYPMPSESQWRKRCHLFKSDKWWATKPSFK